MSPSDDDDDDHDHDVVDGDVHDDVVADNSSTSESYWRHDQDPRRRRRDILDDE